MKAFFGKTYWSETRTILCNSLIALIIAIALVASQQCAPCWAAPPVIGSAGSGKDDSGGRPLGQIGDSGYVVPIPEVNMKSIIGGKPSVPPKPAGPVKESSRPKEAPSADEPSLPPAAPAPPVYEKPAPTVEAPAHPVVKELEPEAAPKREAAQPEVNRLPFDPAHRRGPAKSQETHPAVPVVREKTVEGQLAAPPVAPEETLEAPPLRKDVLKAKPVGAPPGLMEGAPVKGGAKTVPLERVAIDSVVGQGEGVTLDQRGEPEVLPAEPEQPPAKLASVAPPEPPAPEPRTQEPVTPEPTTPEPAPAGQEPAESPEPEKPGQEAPAAVEEPAGVPVRIASPLEMDALRSRDVKEYLTQTAPILEELSLLMTRAPSLAIADFDPSDPNTIIFPKELYMKIDAMKRDLQVLDSKAFAIMPPAKYAAFHSLIRESIIHTYQACDAIINYFNERSDESLQKVHDHLIKAREFVQKTRVAHN